MSAERIATLEDARNALIQAIADLEAADIAVPAALYLAVVVLTLLDRHNRKIATTPAKGDSAL
jgi:hypothetical protein